MSAAGHAHSALSVLAAVVMGGGIGSVIFCAGFLAWFAISGRRRS
jgi:hypothetical protein